MAKQPAALKRYTSLRKQAKARGITVPRGTKLDELEQLVAGTKKPAAVKRAVKSRTTKKRASAKKTKRARVPKGAKSLNWSWSW